MAKRGPGRPKNPPKFKDILNDILPATEIFDEKELEMFNGLVGLYLNDFDESQLSANDMDDIVSIAMNRVLEIRLLKTAKGNTDAQIDASTAIERVRKQTEKLKENLVTRRRDRIDPKKYAGLSIVDIAVAFDEEQKKTMYDRTQEQLEEEDELRKSSLLVGNSADQDADVFDRDEN